MPARQPHAKPLPVVGSLIECNDMRTLARAALLPLLLFPSLLSAAPPLQAGPAFKVGAGGGSQVAVFPDGGFVVVWNALSNQQPNAGTLYARLFDRKGRAVTGEIEILRPAGQIVDSVAALPNGFVVVWDQVNRHQTYIYSVFARVFDRTGAPLGPPAKIHRSSPYSRCCAQVAAAPGGGFAVAWTAVAGTDHAPDYSLTSSVLRRFFDPTGKPLGPEPPEPPVSPPFSQEDFNWSDALAVTPEGVLRDVIFEQSDGSYLNVEDFDGSHATGYEIHGSPADDAAGLDPKNTGASLLADGSFVLAWSSDYLFLFKSTSDIYAQRFRADGTPTSSVPLKVSVRSGREIDPVVTALADGGFVVLWSEIGASPDRPVLGVFGRFFSATGRATTQEFPLSTPGTGPQYFYAAATGPNGDVVATWSQPDPNGGVYARILRAGRH